MSVGESLTTIGILLGLVFIVYTRMKKQDLKDTWNEIKELFVSKEGA